MKEKEPTKIVVDPDRVDILPAERKVEGENDEEASDDDKKSEYLLALSQVWYARPVFFFLFLLTLLGFAFSLFFFLVVLLSVLIRYAQNDPDWANPIVSFASAFAAGLVYCASFFVGIFSPRLALIFIFAYSTFSSKK